MTNETDIGGPSREFPQTRWTVVRELQETDPERARFALDELIRAYWQPVYAFIRRRGYTVEDAKDRTQEFFTNLLHRGSLQNLSSEKGRFRYYIRAALRNYLADVSRRNNAAKRGADRVHLSIDSALEQSLAARSGKTPEDLFEQQWALSLLDRAMARLSDEYQRADRTETFQALAGYLLAGSQVQDSYAEVAGQLGLSEGHLRVLVHRARQRYAVLVREEVAQTVEHPGEIETELSELFDSL